MSSKSLHRYLGLVLCLIMLSISVTGVLLLWKKEYLWLTVEGGREPVNVSLLAEAIDTIEASYDEDELVFIQLNSEDLSLHKVFLSDRRYAWHKQRGDKIQQWSGNQRWEDLILDLHHRFLLGNTIGLNMAGLGGLLLLPLIFLGLIIWWPRRSWLRFAVVPRSFERAVLMRSHGNLGALFALPFVLLAFTGVILIYPTESRLVLLDSVGAGGSAIIQTEAFDSSNGLPSWASLIESARLKFPGSKIRSVQPASSTSPNRTVYLQQRDTWDRLGRTSLKFHPNGELTIKDELQQSSAKRVFDFSYPLHTAKLGLLYRLIMTLVGLALAFLCLLGLLSYLKSLSKN